MNTWLWSGYGAVATSVCLSSAFGCGNAKEPSDSRSAQNDDWSGERDSGTSGEPHEEDPGGPEGSSAWGGNTANPTPADGSSAGPTDGDQGGGHGGVITWDAAECHVPTVALPSDPLALETWTLAHDYCAVLETQGCAPSVQSLAGCSADERIAACLSDVLTIYYQSILPDCQTVWRESIECGTMADFSAGCGGVHVDYPYGPPGACADEGDALLACVTEHPTWHLVEGSYTNCFYGPGISFDCEVTCAVGEHGAGLACSGPEGLPMECSCLLNGHPLNAGSIIAAPTTSIVVKDCADAAQQAAAGLCTSRVECCFAYDDGRSEQCMCGADPKQLGYESCDALAASVMGQRVDICPQYAPPTNTCWPPPC